MFAPVALAAYAAVYAARARTLTRRDHPVPTWRLACFAGGIAALLLATSVPIDDEADRYFSAHMAEHLVIGDIAPLLVVLGCSGPVLAPLLGVRAIGRLRVLTHPVVAFTLWAADLYLWHLRIGYEGALQHDVVHALQHICFFTFGALLWMPLFGPLPKPAWFGNGARLIYIVVVRFGGAVLANILLWSGSALYPDYGPGEAAHGISALADQGAAGVVMMIEQGLVTLGLFAWLFFRAASESEERQRLLDLAAERGVALDEARAARAVAAGQGERLRERIAGPPVGSGEQ